MDQIIPSWSSYVMYELMSYFHPVEPIAGFSSLEEAVLAYWDENDTFRKSIKRRPVDNAFTFYDGPPFATGLPHYGHIVTSVIKDLVPRYMTMKGYRVERRFGWDCHGVPAEFETEKTLGISGKEDIERIGMATFNEACRTNVMRYTQEWVKLITRVARWVDFKDDYKTMDQPFMETVWWVFKQLWDKDLIYQDYKVVHYSWKLSTPYSNFEATLDDAYREREDPSLIVKFRLVDEQCSILAWTTTPWTLPANMALAMGHDITYVRVRYTKDHVAQSLILAKDLVSKHFPNEDTYEIEAEFPGHQMVGKQYEPLLPYFENLASEGAFRILVGEFVSTEDGTGIVHIAPAFGEDDFLIGKQFGVPLINPVDDMGRFTEDIVDFALLNVFAANTEIIRKLKSENKVFAHQTIVHSYPHDWRTDTPLIYRAIPSWYVRVTTIKDQMIANNAKIRWVPDYLRDGAFGNWLQNARDWAISRTRYWGTPLPVWVCEACEHMVIIGSIAELEERSGKNGITDLHRHFIDDITLPCPQCNDTMWRIPDVFDCWFESGSMPYGQIHYPFERRDWFDKNFPADFIVEYTGQLRGWFYTLMVLSTALFDKPPFENVIVHGVTLGEDGRKMSKRLRNYPDPEEIINEYGVDTLRLYLLDHPMIDAKDSRIERQGIIEEFRKFTSPLWNAFSFLVRYADVDNWRPTGGETYELTTLDRWILSNVYALSYKVADCLDRYEVRPAAALLVSFVGDLTNWYIRRSRQRFWQAEQDPGKLAAYATLHEVLVVFSKIAAPFTPLITEVIYSNLTGGESVHLEDWPTPDRDRIDTDLNTRMAIVRQIVSMGLASRARAHLKVRQPLSKMWVHAQQHLNEEDIALIGDELNVKAVEILEDPAKYADLVVIPHGAVIGPRFGKATQQIMKAAKSGDFELLSDGKVKIAQNDDWVFDNDLVDVEYRPRPGFACETDGDLVVVIDVEITNDLRLEGIARDIIRHIQTLRKEAGYRLDDRIFVGVRTDDRSAVEALTQFEHFIAKETLAANITSKSDVAENWDANTQFRIGAGDVEIEVCIRLEKRS
jgi:isoleucyl-tRNA synthetase